MSRLIKLLSVFLATLLVLAFTPTANSSVEDLKSLGFKVSVFDLGDWNVTVIWSSFFSPYKPDLVIEYCGKNLIYYKPYLELLALNVTGYLYSDLYDIVQTIIGSKYVGPGVNLSDPISVARENERRENIAGIFNKVFFEKANGKALGLKAILFRGFFEWNPPALGLIMYFGNASFEAKENIVRKMLQNPDVMNLLKLYNVRYIIIEEALSSFDVMTSSEPSRLIGDLLGKAYWDKISVPENIRNIVKTYWIMGGMGPYGGVSISFNVTAPDTDTIRELIKWIRDNVKQCDVPLVIIFNSIRAGVRFIPAIPTFNSTVKPDAHKTIERTPAWESVDLAMIAFVLLPITLLALVAYAIYRSRSRY